MVAVLMLMAFVILGVVFLETILITVTSFAAKQALAKVKGWFE